MSAFVLELPDWVAGFLDTHPADLESVETRMAFVLGLCREHVRRATGGPFAAAVFDLDAGKLVSVGVNRVEAEQCSLLHAEVVALLFAERRLGRYNLGPGCELVTSAAPCAMCLGAIPWAAPGRVACAARDEDVRAIGFDEGAKPSPWEAALGARGIEVEQDVLRDEAVALLNGYAARGGHIYNGSGSGDGAG